MSSDPEFPADGDGRKMDLNAKTDRSDHGKPVAWRTQATRLPVQVAARAFVLYMWAREQRRARQAAAVGSSTQGLSKRGGRMPFFVIRRFLADPPLGFLKVLLGCLFVFEASLFLFNLVDYGLVEALEGVAFAVATWLGTEKFLEWRGRSRARKHTTRA